MSATATAASVEASPKERLEVLFEELAESTGQRNAIDGRVGGDRGRDRSRRVVRDDRGAVEAFLRLDVEQRALAR